jgi:membrane protease YdiL (CAAX protease family)
MSVPLSTLTPATDGALRRRPWRSAGRGLCVALALLVGGETVGHGTLSWAARLGLDGDLLLLKAMQPALVATYQLALLIAIATWLGGPRRRWALIGAGPARLTVATWIAVVIGLYALKAVATIGFVWLAGGPPAADAQGGVSPLAPLGPLLRSHVWMWLVLAGIVAAVVEEALWRGWVSRTLERSPLGFWAGAVLASLLWASLHLYYPWPIQASLVVMGVALSWLRLTTRSIWPGAVWHVINNVVALIALRIVG